MYSRKVYENLSEQGIVKIISVQEDEYKNSKSNESDTYFVDEDSFGNSYYKKIELNGLSDKDIDMLLKIKQSKDISTIKIVSIIFLVCMIISICVPFLI